MLDLELLRSFVSVVDAGGFTRAGERVHRTQSTVSQQIKRLEEDVGQPLLKRTARDVTPTEAGERLLSYARRLLSLAEEARDVLRAGLTDAAWVSVDDTGACHKAANGVCTQIGNDHFAWFGTTASKSRLNFLDLLRAGHGDYVINAEALAYMGRRGLPGPVIMNRLGKPDTVSPR